MHTSHKAFTLIELLVVIAIIAILSVVVVLTLNPVELLRQSRDSNRLSDMTTLNSALSLYSTDQSSASSFNMGSSSVIYVSIPDPAATSTAGSNCASLDLPTPPAMYSYHCAASSTFRNTNGQGWIPVNFSAISSGSPIGNLPVDPVNQSSSRLFYTYTTNGSQYEGTSVMESAKYGVGGSNDVISGDGGTLASVFEKGSKLGLEPLDYGDPSLVGYWSMSEGTGTVAYDYSGNNASGTWSGSTTNGSYYTTNARIGSYAGSFNGSTTYIGYGTNNPIFQFGMGSFSIAGWFYGTSGSGLSPIFGVAQGANGSRYALNYQGGGSLQAFVYDGTNLVAPGSSSGLANQWVDAVMVVNRTTNVLSLYVDGILNVSSSITSITGNLSPQGQAVSSNCVNSCGGYFGGSIEDVRVYSRALSATQIAAMYAGGK